MSDTTPATRPPSQPSRSTMAWLASLVATALSVSACGGTSDDPAALPDTPAPVADTVPTPSPSPSPSPSLGSPTQLRAAYWMEGQQLKDPCGAPVLLRGVNKMAIYMDRTGNSFPEIAKTGANAVRIMWFSTVPAADAVRTLQRALDSGLIPIWQMHDTTGDFAKMPLVEAFWRNPATIEVLKRFEGRILVNLANEPGTDASDSDLAAAHIRMIQQLRGAGLRMPLIVTASGWGRNVEQLLRVAPAIQQADPLRNMLFDWHVYDAGADMPARIDRAFATSQSQQTPLMIGEFGPVDPGLCSAAVPWKHLITQAQAKGIGWTAWSWDGHNTDCQGAATNNPPYTTSRFNLVSDGINLSSLQPGWATEIVTNDPASLRNTGKRGPWQTLGSCSPAQ